MTDHAILAPSSAHKRKVCPGSRAIEAAYPQLEDSEESREGTAAHWAASELLNSRTIDTGLLAPNGVMLTDEMVEAAELYEADVRATDAEFAGFPVTIEERIDIDYIHADCWGTPDAWRFKPYKLIIWDYKFGHRYVDVFENWQMIEYVAGILVKCGINGISDDRTEVVFRIVQPRCFVGGAPIREWRVMASDLRGYFNALRLSEELSLEPDALCVVNEHCIDCSGRHACVAAQRASYSAMQVSSSTIPFDLPPDALGAELRFVERAIKLLTARQTGLAGQVLATIKRGEQVPFWRIEHGQGRERWSRPNEEILALGDMMGLTLAKPALITPKQAIKAGLDEATVKMFSEIPTGEAKLKPDDGVLARKVFA